MTRHLWMIESRITVGPMINHRRYELRDLCDAQVAEMRSRVRYPAGPLQITALVLWPCTESDDIVRGEYA